MKTVFALACMLAVVTANAQPPPAEGSLESQLTSRMGKATSRAPRETGSNEIVKGKVTYSGIFVALIKTGSPLKFINQSASVDYAPAERYVTRDWSRGPVNGVTVFGIRF